MARQTLYLALDQGGHASRALAFDGQGELIASAFAAIATHAFDTTHVEHDADELVTSLKRVIADIGRQLGDRAAHVVAAGLATQRSSIACWDRVTGESLAPVISWQDRRAASWLQSFAAERHNVHQRTGLMLSPHYGASKLRWCLDHLPAVQAAAKEGRLVCGPLASFLIHRLTREHTLRADPANAGRTLLWNRHTRDWDPSLCALFGVSPTLLPPCGPSYDHFGTLDTDVAVWPLRLVTGDQSAALYAYGEPTAERIHINLGTGAFIQHLQTRPIDHAPRLLQSVVFDDGRTARYALEGTVNGAGSALAWWAERDGVGDWTSPLDAWLADDRPPPLFINGVGGLGSPDWLPQLESRFLGDGDLGQHGCAIVESILFLIQRNLAAFADAGVTARELWVSGGLSQQDGLCQRLANLTGTPVYRPRELEATGRGVAWLLAQHPQPTELASVSTRIFAPAGDADLRARYERWSDAMAAVITSGS